MGGFFALAALMSPDEFGQLAFGLSMLTIGSLIVDGGLGAGIIRRVGEPDKAEIQAVAALQILVAVAVASVVTALAVPMGTTGLVTAIMAWSLPFVAPRMLGVVLTERQLQYGAPLAAEFVETVVFVTTGIAAVLLGLGAMGVACAVVIRAIVGSIMLMMLVPKARVIPRWEFDQVRLMLSFGMRYQAVAVVGVGRDQGLNIGLAALTNVATLGLWSLAYRIMQIPLFVFVSLRRVSYPAMARLREAGGGFRDLLERVATRTVVLTGMIVVPLTAGAYWAIPSLLGDEWSPAAEILPYAGVALLVSGPISVAAVGYLYAEGRATAVLVAAAASSAVWLCVGLGLVRALGLQAVGIAWLAGAVVEAGLFARFVKNACAARLLRATWRPAACASVTMLASIAVGRVAGAGVAGAVTGAVSGALLLLGSMRLVCPVQSRDTWRFVVGSGLVPGLRRGAPNIRWAEED